jgi:hypothetical protein
MICPLIAMRSCAWRDLQTRRTIAIDGGRMTMSRQSNSKMPMTRTKVVVRGQ